MADNVGIRVEGAAQLRRTLRRAGDDLTDLKGAHAAAGAIAGQAARTNGPRRTGRLLGSVRWSGSATGAVVRAGRASVPYAMPIHWGWPSRGITAQPWVTKAAQDTEPVWSEVYADAVQRILNRVRGA